MAETHDDLNTADYGSHTLSPYSYGVNLSISHPVSSYRKALLFSLSVSTYGDVPLWVKGLV